MFSFRKKPKQQDDDGQHIIRASPSLPELTSQGIPWPESLVDLSTLQDNDVHPVQRPQKGAAKISFHNSDRPIAFHKPLWLSSPGISDSPSLGSISQLYTSVPPPSAFESRKLSHGRSRPPRRPKIPPTFNVMVVGGQGTGKTSLLRLLLETADVSPTALPEQKAAMDNFLRQRSKRTQSIQTACLEICESRYDRVLLSVVDTPGLDFHESRALKLDRQVTGIIKYLDTQYADTLNEEAKVVRQSKGDQHIHLCIYMIDPTSVVSISARRALSSLPTKTRSETTISYHSPEDLQLASGDASDDSDDEESDKLTMSPAELRVIRRLSSRANVLPVIARADSLTDERLMAVKHAVRRELREAGLDFGVFGAPNFDQTPAENGHSVKLPTEVIPEDSVEGGRQSRPVIKLRSRPDHHPNTRRSRSRSKRDYSENVEEPLSPETDSVANVRFSAQIIAKMDLSDLMPFALIAPEPVAKKAFKDVRTLSRAESGMTDTESSIASPSEDDHDRSLANGYSPTGGVSKKPASFMQGPPADLKGVFLRKFRWGTVDVLDPNHCDFAALRTAVLSTHMMMLKIRTKEVLYEKYRTEKLLAKRATKNISEAETRKLLEDLGL